MLGSTLDGNALIGVSPSEWCNEGGILVRLCFVRGEADYRKGWAKFMQWKYPVEVVYTSKRTFQATGAVAAGASL